MIALRCGLAVVLLACAEPRVPGAYDALPLSFEREFGLGAPVQVARDKFGIAHVSGQSVRDVAFAQGYVTAHDRLLQMDTLRRFASGRLGELYGAGDPSVLQTDYEMRMYQLDRFADATRAALPRPVQFPIDRDAELVELLDGYAAGVNAYMDNLAAGDWTLDPVIAGEAAFQLQQLEPWTAGDSLAILRLHTFGAAWIAPEEIALDELYSIVDRRFTAAAPTAAERDRAGLAKDLLRFAPIAERSTIAGFPAGIGSEGPPTDGLLVRPVIAQGTFDAPAGFFRRGARTGPLGRLGPHAFMQPHVGGSSFAVGPNRTSATAARGPAFLASIHQAQLSNPSLYYPTHLAIADTEVDVIGVTIPGVPGVIYGTNGTIAWTATPGRHDVDDVYREPAAASTFPETVLSGGAGIEPTPFAVTYEVAAHGPVIPKYDPATNLLVGRVAGEQILAVESAGYGPSFAIAALWKLVNARSIGTAREALRDIDHGPQSWMVIDAQRSIGWQTAKLPVRSPDAFHWNAGARAAPAPMFAFDGADPRFDWIGSGDTLDDRTAHAIDPPAGYLVAAGADPVGTTFDGDPLDVPVAAELGPLYPGASYAAGFQHDRIATLIERAGIVTEDTMVQIQLDTRSNAGAALRDPIVVALQRALDPTVLGELTAVDRRRVETARDILARWTFATPTSITIVPAQPDSVATAVFNAWIRAFLRRVLCDELGHLAPPQVRACSLERFRADYLVRLVHALLVAPATFVAPGPDKPPIVCDDFTRAGIDSCNEMIVVAAIDAMQAIETATGSTDPATWRWGDLHQLAIEPLFPTSGPMVLRLPDDAPGYPRAGDQFAVDTADVDYTGTGFSTADGAALRMLAVARPDELIELRLQLPGGTIFDSRDPHYRDLLDLYLQGTHFIAPYSLDQIIDAGEYRWDFR